ncbi:MAG: hypothetical protein QM728_02415 [Gordonia sp. (in: high G+C Gram-positive bacteria)]|uniref:hypothetical protein n=1 Tax=Gordonia sp. (in: high G+C Gram-positive bacteria) TaxID=84139 RepID=UPI0039E3A325
MRIGQRTVAMVVAVLLCGASALIATGFGVGTACACSCAPAPANEVIADAAAIAVGTPTRIKRAGDGTKIDFTVDRSYKKALPELLQIDSTNSAACGVEPELGKQTVLVLARDEKSPGTYGAWLCDNLNVAENDVRAHAGPPLLPTPVVAHQGTPTRVIVTSLALLLIATAILVAVGRQRT